MDNMPVKLPYTPPKSFRFNVEDSEFRGFSNPGGIISICVEFAKKSEGVAVRDTKNPGTVLFFTHAEWDVFVDGIRKNPTI